MKTFNNWTDYIFYCRQLETKGTPYVARVYGKHPNRIYEVEVIK